VERAAGGVLSRTGLAWAPGVERAGRASPPLRRPPSTVVALGAPLFLFGLARGPLPLTWGLRVPRRNTPRLYLSLPLSRFAATSRDISEREEDGEREREREKDREAFSAGEQKEKERRTDKERGTIEKETPLFSLSRSSAVRSYRDAPTVIRQENPSLRNDFGDRRGLTKRRRGRESIRVENRFETNRSVVCRTIW